MPRTPFVAEDLSKALVATPLSLTPEAANLPPTNYGLYLRENTASPATYTLVSEPSGPLPPAGSWSTTNFQFAAATPDLSHVVLRSTPQLLPGAPTGALYEWTDGQLRFASVLPDGSIANGLAGARTVGEAQRYPGGNPISEDGTRIYWTSGSVENGPLYLRENAAATKLVSASERDGDDPEVPRNAVFLFATPDGSQTFFSSGERLTDDATAQVFPERRDLYRWSADAPEGERLTNLTPGPVVTDGEGGAVIGDVAGSGDGSHFYFVARGELAPGAVSGQENLYLWRQGEGVRHVATLSAADGAVWSTSRTSGAGALTYRDARPSEDGNRLLFLSRQADLTDHDTAGTRQAYLYDAAEHEITCVSCSPLSEPSTADVDLLQRFFAGGGGPFRVPLRLPRNLSDDGSRVFFETEQRLVPEDTNNRVDVYEWHAGELKLVSDGKTGHDARFVGASADGEDAFFTTRARLSGWDRDDLRDVYRATTGATFPEPRPHVGCSGDECQGSSPTVPGDLSPGSAELGGEGNPQAVTLSARSLPNRAARRLARGKPIAVRADVTGPPGRITAVARANLRRGMARAGRVTAQVQEAGRVVVRGLRLQPRALRVLRQRGQLRVRVVVRYADEQDGQRVNLRRSGQGGRR